jgi:hypothetical protein
MADEGLSVVSSTPVGRLPISPAATTVSHQTASKMSERFVKRDLLKTLESIQTSGSFAFSSKLTQPPPCDISVPGIGRIRMPLEAAQAQELIGLARQAPYGKGEETIVDTSVRNTWELDASQFVCEHPKWEQWVQTMCNHVVKPALGIAPMRPVRAELYKMLIYERGAMFKAHTE